MSLEYTSIPLADMEVRTVEDRHFIEGICVPWGRRTDRVEQPEMFSRGAFSDLVASGAKVKLIDYNHDEKRIPVGYSTLIEDRDAGLWARFKINDTPEGDSAIRNTNEGVYGGLSIGFLPRSDRIVDGVRHIDSARLHHVSLVEEPAYREAQILAVRSAQDAEIAEWRRLINSAPTLDTRPHTSQNLLIAQIRRRSFPREP